MSERIRRIRLTGLVLVCLVAFGCGEDQNTPEQPIITFAPPSELAFTNGNGNIELRWVPSPDEGLADFGGYNIYADRASMANLGGAALNERLVASVFESSFRYEVDNGVIHYFAVRSSKLNGDLSAATEELSTAARPDGEIMVGERGNPSALPAIDLAGGSALAMDPSEASRIDLYLGTAHSADDPEFPLVLKSPHLVVPSSAEFVRRIAGLKLISDWDEVTTSGDGFGSQVTLGSGEEAIGKVVAILTPATEPHYAKVRVKSVVDSPGGRLLTLEFAYQTLPNYPRF